MPIEAISSSPCMAMPPTFGSSRIIAMRIPEAGVIGYPAKKVHPASIAPRTIAVAPSTYSRRGASVFVVMAEGYPQQT
jgi:hypothetical protein